MSLRGVSRTRSLLMKRGGKSGDRSGLPSGQFCSRAHLVPMPVFSPLSREMCIRMPDPSKRTESKHPIKPSPIIQTYKWLSCPNFPRGSDQGVSIWPIVTIVYCHDFLLSHLALVPSVKFLEGRSLTDAIFFF